jgi:mevalonate kinase
MTTEDKIIEYWKITKWNRLLETLKEEGVRVTRDEKEDIKIKIKLMQEAEEFGRESQKQKIIEAIEKFTKKKYQIHNVDECDCCEKNLNNIQELLNSLGDKKQ